jgi:DtxR family Mn-dependent transcriptional regulator
MVASARSAWHDPPMPKQVSNVASDDYLTAIYRLNHDEGQDVIAVRLADRLEITPPSVAGMLKRLQRDRLVTLDSRKVIHLTPEGLRRAEQMVRRHRLAECLITEILKVPWWRAYEEAHLLEHGISDITEPHLFETLGRPHRSPFGYPIPGANPDRQLSMITLADVPEGESVNIDRVFEEDERLLQFFDQEGIRPGETVTVETVAPYRGTIPARLNGRSVVMGTQVAERIWVDGKAGSRARGNGATRKRTSRVASA